MLYFSFEKYKDVNIKQLCASSMYINTINKYGYTWVIYLDV